MNGGHPAWRPGVRSVLADEVFHRIGEAIVTGELADGERLRDNELADSLNVSRMPVREALLRLERVGLVEISPSRYTRVTFVTDELVAVHRELAGYAAGLAAHMAIRRLTDQQLAEAVDLLDRIVAAVPDPERGSSARRDFFSFLSRHSGNDAHHRLMADIEFSLRRTLARGPLDPGDPERDRELCSAMRAALLRRDADDLERHIRRMHGVG